MTATPFWYGVGADRRGRVMWCLGRFRTRPDLLVIKRMVRAEQDGWWLCGDNDLATDDSRRYGVADVTGRVILQWWPRLRRL